MKNLGGIKLFVQNLRPINENKVKYYSISFFDINLIQTLSNYLYIYKYAILCHA